MFGTFPHSVGARGWWAAFLPLLLYVLHASAFGSWIVDDAGISYSYARSLASGEGLVAQSGSVPVEGFSNALWTLLLAGAEALGVFHSVRTAKSLSVALVGISFILLSFTLVKGWGRSPLAVGLALATTAALTPFVVWTVSGLENPLFVCLLSALVAISLSIGRRDETNQRDALPLALVCFLLFLTRPDGLLYVVLPPFFIGLVGSHEDRPHRRLAWFGIPFVLLFLLATFGRIAYFRDVFPNTYYAKEGPLWRQTAALLDSLGVPIGGAVFSVIAAMLLVCAVALCFLFGRALRAKGVPCSPLLVLAIYSSMAYVAFELMPTDWMPELRFATPFFLFVPLLVLEIVFFLTNISHPKRSTMAQSLVGVVLVLLVSAYSVEHTCAFLKSPTVPFQSVRELSVTLGRFATGLGLDRAMVLLPDIGGSLWEGRFEVLDIAGLTDRTIGRTLEKDRDAFSSYLRQRSPDLVWLHGNWRKRTDLEELSWFRRAYVVCTAASFLERQDGVLYVRNDVAKPLQCRSLESRESSKSR